MSNNFEPKIIGFLCNWCAYAGGDLAGVSRLQYPPNMRAVRVMCSGMVHPDLVVDTLVKGADGVIIMGWHLGECHYLEGNHIALARAEAIQMILEDFGIDPRRFAIEWVSSAEAPRFAEVVTRFTETIRTLGPNPLNAKNHHRTEAVV
jgi:F420-non-reducing hydrogenase iron-sulfur subunit